MARISFEQPLKQPPRGLNRRAHTAVGAYVYFMAHNSTIMSRCTAGEQRTHTDGSERDDGIEPVDIELNGGELAARA